MRWGEWVVLEESITCPFCMCLLQKGEKALVWGERKYCSETCKKAHQYELKAEESVDR